MIHSDELLMECALAIKEKCQSMKICEGCIFDSKDEDDDGNCLLYMPEQWEIDRKDKK